LQVESLLRQEHTRFPGYKLEVIVEYTRKIISEDNTRKRPLTLMDSPSKSPAPRRTRTVQQEEVVADRRDKNEKTSDFSEQLIDK
jgi:hypothetical protein